MSFRRTGHSDERRRRVLMDDSTASADDGATAKPTRERKQGKTRNYSDAALAAQQPPITVLIPSRAWTLSVLLLSGLTLIVLLNLLHGEYARIARFVGAEQADAFNFAVRGNLAAWLSATLLGLSAVMSAQVYNLRRHRVDDYKGRYRIWIWLTVLLVAASIDAASGLHDAVAGALLRLSGKTATLSVSACWLIVGGLLLTSVATRMALEMRRSIGTLVALSLAMVCYLVASLVRVGTLGLTADLGWHALVTSTLLGHLLVWFTTLSYAAHVYLDAQGLLNVKKPKEAKKKKAVEKPAPEEAEKTPSGKTVRIDNAHGEPAAAKPAPSAGGPLKGAMISAATVKTPAGAPAENAKLSKAERKKLRRQE